APVLVLRPSRGVHRGDPVLRHRRRDPAGVQPQATVRVQGHGRRHDRHRRAVDDRMGAPHVHHRRDAAAVLLAHDILDRGTDRGEVLHLDGQDVARPAPLRGADPSPFAFLAPFLRGGLTGFPPPPPPLDFAVSDTYFVVAHFHYVLFGTVVFCM